jgi:phosphoribosylformylglycinamidine cyclo-ligase
VKWRKSRKNATPPTMSQYQSLGTSADKAELHAALKSAGLSDGSKFFAQMLPDFAGDESYLSFVHSDGAGTKSLVAYLIYKETGDPSVFKGIAQDALVMNLDDLFCVGPCEGLVLSNAIARNAHLVGESVLTELFKGYKDCVEDLKKFGVNISLGGGETADVGDVVRTILVDATLCGRIKKVNLVDTSKISEGDAIVGLASFGTCKYDKFNNSGIGSNGLTLARHALIDSSYQEKYPEITALENSTRTISSGKFKLSDSPNKLGMTIGEALLSPTRTYAPVLTKIFKALSGRINGVIHNTGGGLSKVIRFGKGNRYVKNDLFPTPELFKLIQESTSVSAQEMCRVFNLGQRLEIYLPDSEVQTVIKVAESLGVQAKKIGYVEKSKDPRQNEVVVTYGNEEVNFTHKL